MFYLAGIFITFFLSVLLAGKKSKSTADKVLTVWLVVMGLHLTAFYLYLSGNYEQFPWLLGWELPLPLVHGPFLFLYLTTLTESRRIKITDLLHFIPVIITLVLMIPFLRLSPEQKILVYQSQGAGYEWLTQSIFVALIISGITYVILAFFKLQLHRANIENRFSNTARINLNWLRYLILGTSAIWIAIIVGLGDLYIFGTVVLFIFFIGYFGIRQVGIFTNSSHVTNAGETMKEEIVRNPIVTKDHKDATAEVTKFSLKPKYQKSSLSKEEAGRIHEELHMLMIRDKLFKEAELDLSELADKLGIHPNTLSQVINSYENKTFYDYVNGLRIEEFKTLVADPANRQYTLLSLAFECGFNSKTAFNRNFKKATGLSPSEYLNEVKISLA